MRYLSLAAVALALAATSACVAPVGPVQVTRFHLPDTAALGHGAITVEPAPGEDGASLEFRTYAAAVARQLVLAGYSEQVAGSAPQVAQVRIRRASVEPVRRGGPVSVGIGGSTGSFGSGVGLGIGLDLSGPPAGEVDTELSVTIRERAGDRVLWEGRARFTVSARSPLANSQLGAARMTEALFKGFPGTSGETIEVK